MTRDSALLSAADLAEMTDGSEVILVDAEKDAALVKGVLLGWVATALKSLHQEQTHATHVQQPTAERR